MKAGDTWRGMDGTTYHVVLPSDVLEHQPRWWVGEELVEFYMLARQGMLDGYSVGPEDSLELHFEPLCNEAGCDVAFALVPITETET